MMPPAMISSKSCEWETPDDVFSPLNREFMFELDVAASPENAKCAYFFTQKEDGLARDWSGFGPVWMNPPYGRKIGKWIQKAKQEADRGVTVVGLLPARTDTRWFHDHIYSHAEVRFLPGRICFSGRDRAPFPSMIVIWRGGTEKIE